MDIILASASPRRCELLKFVCGEFRTVVSDFEEIAPAGLISEKLPEYFALGKAKRVAGSYSDSVVIGADTAVILEGKALGKPSSDNEARKMLLSLSGKTHKVITGCAVISGEKSVSFSVCTEVKFYPLSCDEIEKYIKTGEPFDKAGAYGIQGKGALFVEKINGDYYNVVGLPIAKLKRVLEQDFQITL